MITVRPNDRVWWVWQGGKKVHNILQVTSYYTSYFVFNLRCTSIVCGHLVGIFCTWMLKTPDNLYASMLHLDLNINHRNSHTLMKMLLWHGLNQTRTHYIVYNIDLYKLLLQDDILFFNFKNEKVVLSFPDVSCWCDCLFCCLCLQVSHQGDPIEKGFCSGAPRDAPSAFVHQFQTPGVFYFLSHSLPKIFGAIVVSTQPQVCTHHHIYS